MKFDAHNNCTNAAVASHITDAPATTVMPSVKQCAVHRQLIRIQCWREILFEFSPFAQHKKTNVAICFVLLCF